MNFYETINFYMLQEIRSMMIPKNHKSKNKNVKTPAVVSFGMAMASV